MTRVSFSDSPQAFGQRSAQITRSALEKRVSEAQSKLASATSARSIVEAKIKQTFSDSNPPPDPALVERALAKTHSFCSGSDWRDKTIAPSVRERCQQYLELRNELASTERDVGLATAENERATTALTTFNQGGK
jgi:hypothetical protein